MYQDFEWSTINERPWNQVWYFNVTKTVPEVSLLALATAWQPVNQLVFHESYILQLKT